MCLTEDPRRLDILGLDSSVVQCLLFSKLLRMSDGKVPSELPQTAMARPGLDLEKKNHIGTGWDRRT